MKRKLQLILVVLSAIVMLFLPAGCANNDSTSDTANAGPVRTDLNLALAMSVATFDPYYNVSDPVKILINSIYEPLYVSSYAKQTDGTVTVDYIPTLAESYEVSTDGKTYTFHLRQGVKFQDGTELKASDVVFSFKRAMESPMMQSYLDPVADVTAQDDSTVIFSLKEALAPFLEDVCNVPVMSEAFVNKAGEKISEQTCGTGPYCLSESIPEQKYTLTAYADYYRGEAKIKTIICKVIPDVTTQVMSFESGELDMLGVPASNWGQISASDKYKTYKTAVPPAAALLVMNTEKKPFDDVKVRQAINYAIDRESINSIAFEGTAELGDAVVPHIVFGACEPDHPYNYDPAKAKQLLAEAGYPNGLTLPPIEVLANDIGKSAQVIQQNLAAIGITVEVQTVEPNSLFAKFGSGDYTMTIAGMALPSDYYFWQACLGTDYINVYNLARYSNKNVDQLFAQAAKEFDPEKREAVYGQIVNIVNDDAVYAPIIFSTNLTATNPKLSFDVPVEAMTYYDLYWTN